MGAVLCEELGSNDGLALGSIAQGDQEGVGRQTSGTLALVWDASVPCEYDGVGRPEKFVRVKAANGWIPAPSRSARIFDRWEQHPAGRDNDTHG